jgi:prevent-host-death family protein
MSKVGAREARVRFSEILTQAAFKGERIVLTRNGKDLAAIVPMDDLRMIEEIEDRIDLEEARKIMAGNPDLIPWDEFERSAEAEGKRKPSPGSRKRRRNA